MASVDPQAEVMSKVRARGDLAFAEKDLGRPYSIPGPVVPGRGAGK